MYHCKFLADVPADALCAQIGRRYASEPEPGHTPSRKQPAAGSRADIERFVRAMFNAWHNTGYIRINPMAVEGPGAHRTIKAHRAIDVDLYELVLATMEREQVDRPSAPADEHAGPVHPDRAARARITRQ